MHPIMSFEVHPHQLEQKHVHDCRVFARREQFFDHLPNNAVGIELGVAGGDFSEEILKRSRPKKLYLNDLYCGDDMPYKERYNGEEEHLQFIRSRFAKELSTGQVELLKGPSQEMIHKIKDHSLDWIYIDASHDYEFVKEDLWNAMNKIKSDGVIMLNDYVMYCPIAHKHFGIVQAVNLFCVEQDWRIAAFAFNNHMYADVALIPSERRNPFNNP
jgi:hypothetical protein